MKLPNRHPGFTMVELLVSMGILVLIGSITLVAYSKIMGTADRTRISYQFQTISAALDAYKTDFNSFPATLLDDNLTSVVVTFGDNVITADKVRGARTLCKALLGPGPQDKLGQTSHLGGNSDQDGAEGFGFRVQSRSGVFRTTSTNLPSGNPEIGGKVYGPYLAADKFKVAKTDAAGKIDLSSKAYDDTTVLLDANEYPILYYPVLNPQPTMTVANAYVGPTGPTLAAPTAPLPMYRSSDDSAWLNPNDLMDLLGDKNHNGAIDAGETATVRGKYILYSPGPDGFYGVNTLDVTKTAKQKADRLDDVTNIE